MIAALAVIALVHFSFVVACVDGVTPNCSDPAIQCGPSIAADAHEAQPLLEAAPVDGGGTDTAVDDVADTGDPDADAGDEI